MQNRDMPLQFPTFLGNILTRYEYKVAWHQQARAGALTAPYVYVLQQRGGDKLLKGLGYCKFASSLGKGQLRLSKRTASLAAQLCTASTQPLWDAMN